MNWLNDPFRIQICSELQILSSSVHVAPGPILMRPVSILMLAFLKNGGISRHILLSEKKKNEGEPKKREREEYLTRNHKICFCQIRV
jgi:hypothetical protein